MNLTPTLSSKRFRNLISDMLVLFGINSVIGQVFQVRGFFISGLILVLYYFLFEFFLGKTPGKFYTHTKVVMSNGNNLTFGAILIRSVIRLIPFEAISFLSSKNPVGWHDKWSKTIVIEDI